MSMFNDFFKYSLPRGLYGRAALILILPIIIIQLVVSIIFLQRHFEDVTRQMTQTVIRDIKLVRQDPDLLPLLGIRRIEMPKPIEDTRVFYDLSGIVVTYELHQAFPDLGAVDLATNSRQVRVSFPEFDGMLIISRRRVSASNPHQLLVLMVFTSIIMTGVAYIFLRNQLRPIRRLAVVAEAFGRGQNISFIPSGAREVRAAGMAFLDMRNRIDRHIEQRTLLLSGVSHDLRTPLTRLRLGLSLIDSAEAQALLSDVKDMQDMIDMFLAFARENSGESPRLVDPIELICKIIQDYERLGHEFEMQLPADAPLVSLRPMGFTRALENLVKNAIHHATHVCLSLDVSDKTLVIAVEDNGPGIDPEAREAALRPFTRLDEAREATGGSVGLGLAIVTDVIRSHGGQFRLENSARLGGVRAVIVIPR